MLTFKQMEPLTPEEQKLVEENLGLVGYYVSHWGKSNWLDKDADDIYQCAVMGLMRAVKTWDPKKGTLSTYCHHTVNRAISSYVIGDCTIRPPENKILVAGRIKKKMDADKSLTYESDEIRQMYHFYSPKAVRNMVESEAFIPMTSIDHAPNTGKPGKHEIVASQDQQPDEILEEKQDKAAIIAAIEKIPLTKPTKRSKLPIDIKRIVIKEHCLKGRTLESVGKDHGVSREWIRILKDEALTDLRRLMK